MSMSREMLTRHGPTFPSARIHPDNNRDLFYANSVPTALHRLPEVRYDTPHNRSSSHFFHHRHKRSNQILPESSQNHLRLPSLGHDEGPRGPSSPSYTQLKELSNGLALFVFRYRTILLTYTLCFSGLIWQTVLLSNEYFSYQLVSSVEYTKDDSVRPPAFTICFPYFELIDTSKYGFHFTDLDSPQKRSQAIMENFTIERLLKVTPELQEIVKYIWIQRRWSYGISSSFESLDIKKFIKEYYVCYRIMHMDADSPNFYLRSHHVTFGSKPGALLGLAFEKENLKGLTRAVIYLHPVNVFPRGDRDFPLTLLGDQYNGVSKK